MIIRKTKYAISVFVFLVSLNPILSQSFSSQKTFRAGMQAFKEHNYYAARLIFQEIFHKDRMGEYGDDAQYYLALTYYYEESYEPALFELMVLLRDFPVSPYLIRAQYWVGECHYYLKEYKEALASHYNFVNTYPESSRSPYAYYTIGYIYNTLKRYDDAIFEFENALKKYPNSKISPNISLQLGIAHYNNKDYKKSRAQFHSLVIQYGKEQTLDAQLWIGKTYYAEDNYSQAQKQFNFILDEYPDSDYVPDAVYHLALIAYKQSDIDMAISWLKLILIDYSDWYNIGSVYFRLGQVYHEQKNYGASSVYYKKVVENYPDNEFFLSALEFLGETYQKSLKPDEALDIYKNLLNSYDLNPEMERIILRKAGNILFSKGDFSEAVKYYETFNKKYPTDKSSAEIMYLRAQSLYTAKLYNESVDVLEELIKKYPKSTWKGDAYFLQGEISFALTDYRDALQKYNKVKKFYKNHRRYFDSNMGIGWTYFELKQFSRASDQFRKTMNYAKTPSEFAKVLLAISSCRYNLRDFKGAIDYYNKIMDEYPDTEESEEALFQIGWVHYRQNQYVEAGDTFEKYLYKYELGKRKIEAGYFLSWCYFHTGNLEASINGFLKIYDNTPRENVFKEKSLIDYSKTLYLNQQYWESIDSYRKFIKEYPESSSVEEAYYSLSNAYLAMKMPDQVEILYEKMKKKKPDSVYLKEILQNLGDYLKVSGKLRDADQIFQKMIQDSKTFDEYVDINFHRMQMFMEVEKYQDAIEVAYSMLQSNSEEIEPYRLQIVKKIISIYIQTGQYTKAEETLKLQKSNKLNDTRIEGDLMLMEVEVTMAQQKYSEAIIVLKKLMENSAFSIVSRYYTGICYYQLEKYNYALDFFQQASQSKDEYYSSWSLYYLGEIRLSRGDYIMAAREFSKIVYLYSGNTDLYEKSLFKAAYSFHKAEKKEESKIYREKLIEAFPESKFIKELNSIDDNEL